MLEVDRKVITGIRNAVNARGADWRYPNFWVDGVELPKNEQPETNTDWLNDVGGCYNLLPDGSAACIIGFIAVDQGLETGRSSSANTDAARWGVSASIHRAMEAAQDAQDQGFTWGEAEASFFSTLDQHGFDYSDV